MTKVISLSDKAYQEMKLLKRPGESFSDVVLKLRTYVPRTHSILDLFGKWPGPKEELDQIEKTLLKDRKKFRLRDANVLP